MELSFSDIRQLASSNEGVDVEFKETTGQLKPWNGNIMRHDEW